jgi:WhiB family redox-sensing transcriptional regulator
MTRDLPDFVFDALCAQTDSEVFFPEAGSRGKAVAVKVCRSCPAEVDCRKWAVAQPDLLGIWGGTSAHDRKKLRGDKAA